MNKLIYISILLSSFTLSAQSNRLINDTLNVVILERDNQKNLKDTGIVVITTDEEGYRYLSSVCVRVNNALCRIYPIKIKYSIIPIKFSIIPKQ